MKTTLLVALAVALAACGRASLEAEWIGGNRELSADPTVGVWTSPTDVYGDIFTMDHGRWTISKFENEGYGCQAKKLLQGTWVDDPSAGVRRFTQTSATVTRKNCEDPNGNGVKPSSQVFSGPYQVTLGWGTVCSAFDGTCRYDHQLTLVSATGETTHLSRETYPSNFDRRLTLNKDGTWSLRESRTHDAPGYGNLLEGCTEVTTSSGTWLQSKPGTCTFANPSTYTVSRTGCSDPADNRTFTVARRAPLDGELPCWVESDKYHNDWLNLTVKGVSGPVVDVAFLRGPCRVADECPVAE